MKAPTTHGLFPGLLALLWLAATVPSALMAGEAIKGLLSLAGTDWRIHEEYEK